MPTEQMITWNDADPNDKVKAFAKFSDVVDSYEGVSKSSHRDFLDIETDKSVRPGFRHSDYYAFRSEEQVPLRQKRAIKMCMDAYDKVGIVRNIIDLMGDFGSQGINIVHENKSVEKFFRQWFKKVEGKERSERFLNNLYKTGQVFIYKSYADITPEITKYIKSMGQDIVVEVPNIEKGTIPWRYNFFNPLTIDMKDGNISIFLGRKNFEITATSFFDNFKDGTIPAKILDTLPPDIKKSIEQGDKKIPLDPERLHVAYYKKDDWQQWAHPLTYAILDDIIMLEKMRLADLSALDGAISNIRLWTIGSLDHKILPSKRAINKLRNILASNVGGGTMELVWGPELSYTESNSQVYKFLGSEKYQSVLNSIYAGLGVPPTLTGIAGNGGGFTNNFISLKTLVERLQYGRDQLVKFWEKELEIVRRAMGFRKSAHIVFDQMSLSDEASEKNLLIQLADRDIISHETILERFKYVPSIEKVRLKREQKERKNDDYPDKASPYHNANHKQEMEKIDKQAETQKVEKESKEIKDNGRPPLKKDDGPRKKRVDTPKSTPGLADMIVWAIDTFDSISKHINQAFLSVNNKTNMRQLTKSQVLDLETLKLDVLTNVQVMKPVTARDITDIVSAGERAPMVFNKFLHSNRITPSDMPIDQYKKSIIGTYIEFKSCGTI
jgi:hypothetical protein